jgi:hypothetical protein
MFFAALVAMPAATAQGGCQSGQPVYRVEASVSPSQVTITERFGQALFEIDVKAVPCQASPVDDQTRIDFQISDKSVVPNGWSEASIDPLNKAGVRVGESFKVKVTITIQSPDVASEIATLSVQITSTPRSTSPVAPPTALPGYSMSDSANVSMTAKRQLTTAESVTNFADKNKWWLVSLGVGAILLAVALMRRKASINVDSEQPTQEVVPGRGASFPVRIHNPGNQADSFMLSAGEAPKGWSVILPVETLDLAGGDLDTVWVTVKSPPTAQAGERISFRVYVSSRQRAGLEGEVSLQAVVVDRYQGPGPSTPQPAEATPSRPPKLTTVDAKPLTASRRPKSR